MPKKMEKIKKNLLQNMALFTFFATLFCNTLLPSANALNPVSSSPLQSISATVIPLQPQPVQGPQPQQPQQQPLQVPPQPQQPQQRPLQVPPQPQQPQQQPLQVPPQPQQNQQVVSPPPQFPQISWDELEETESFIANGKMDSTLYTINGNWRSTGDWSMNVADGELMNFTTTMAWYNGTAGHTHEFLNFEADEDGVDISAEDQTISVAGTMDVGTNTAVAWEDVPSEIVIQGGKIIAVSVDDEATDEHFSGQSVHGNVTSLSICSTTPGPAMQVSPAC
jgi:hypothetical protein